jgi:hypothetical protein
MPLTTNPLMCCSLGNLIIKGKLRANCTTENVVWSSIIAYKSFDLCFNFIPFKNKAKCLLLIITTLTMYRTKSNQGILVFILNINKASTNSKHKSMTWRGLDINGKVNFCLCWLKYSSYNILSFRKAIMNLICNRWIVDKDKRRCFSIYCLNKGIKLWPFHTWKGKLLYNNQIQKRLFNSILLYRTFQNLAL